MALTKISDTGVKTSNAPSNGKFLQYKDGTDKLTWATVESVPSEVTVSANNTANETVYPTFVDGATGAQGLETDTGLSYNPSTNRLTAGGFIGNGSSLNNLNFAFNDHTGVIGASNMGTGTASSSTFLRGDRTWQPISAAPEV